MSVLVFFPLAILLVIGAISIVAGRGGTRGVAAGWVAASIGLAGLSVAMDAPLVAGVQLVSGLVGASALAVLGVGARPTTRVRILDGPASPVRSIVGVVVLACCWVAFQTRVDVDHALGESTAAFGQPSEVVQPLFEAYGLPLELAGVLLVVSLVGLAVLVREEG